MAIFHFPERVNEKAARVVAGVVAVLAIASIVLSSTWLIALLAAGFLLRVAWGPKLSPLGRFAVWLASHLGAPRPVPGRPKRFAQAIGAVVTLVATGMAAAQLTLASNLVLVVLVVFATLESGLGFCFGCWLFGRAQALGWIAPDTCDVCVSDRPPPHGAASVREPDVTL